MFSNFKTILPAKNRYTFDIQNVDIGVINAIRRIILSEIPVVGFDGEISPSLNVIANTGPLHNEFVLHRFGLIPIHMSEDDTETFNEDDYEFELKLTNKSVNTLDVSSKDFQVRKNDQPLSPLEVAKLFPPDSITKDHILITRLRPEETIHVQGKAIKSTASHHAGFSPVSLCTFSFVQDPNESSKANNVLEKERAYMKNEYGDPTMVHFEIETETALKPKYLVHKAFEILLEKIQKILNNKESLQFTRTDNGGQFSFENEDDTLGNFLQSTMHDRYIREKRTATKDKIVSFVGYYCPHPLDKVMILRFNFEEDASASDEDYIDTLCEHCNRSLSYLQQLQTAWQENAS
jgi:DNA-directed RNA polymerase alpha subunit